MLDAGNFHSEKKHINIYIMYSEESFVTKIREDRSLSCAWLSCRDDGKRRGGWNTQERVSEIFKRQSNRPLPGWGSFQFLSRFFKRFLGLFGTALKDRGKLSGDLLRILSGIRSSGIQYKSLRILNASRTRFFPIPDIIRYIIRL